MARKPRSDDSKTRTGSGRRSSRGARRPKAGETDAVPARENEPVKIGERLRELRFRNGWTLDDVRRMTGISPSVVSKLENDQGAINIDTLQKLCHGLNLSIDRLTRPAGIQGAGVRAVNRLDGGTLVRGDRVQFRLLSEELVRKEIFPALITTEKTAADPGEDWISFAGERFLFVVSGSVLLMSEFYAPLRLEQGESTQFDASMRHGVVSATDEPATFLSLSFDATGHADMHAEITQQDFGSG